MNENYYNCEMVAGIAYELDLDMAEIYAFEEDALSVEDVVDAIEEEV